jgi:uncharacterized protein YdaT
LHYRCVEIAALQIQQQIKNKVKGVLINVKFDTASRLGKSVLGVNIQFYSQLEGKFVIRTIGMIVLNTSHTASVLCIEVCNLLERFGIEKEYILSTTTDNAENVICVGKKMRDMQHSLILAEKVREWRHNLMQECENESDEQESDDDVGEETTTISLSEADELVKDLMNRISSHISIVRCGAHIIQLGTADAVSKLSSDQKSVITKIRTLAKLMRTQTCKRDVILLKFKHIPLDTEVRWSSTYRMLSSALASKTKITLFEELQTHKNKPITLFSEDL